MKKPKKDPGELDDDEWLVEVLGKLGTFMVIATGVRANKSINQVAEEGNGFKRQTAMKHLATLEWRLGKVTLIDRKGQIDLNSTLPGNSVSRLTEEGHRLLSLLEELLPKIAPKLGVVGSHQVVTVAVENDPLLVDLIIAGITSFRETPNRSVVMREWTDRTLAFQALADTSSGLDLAVVWGAASELESGLPKGVDAELLSPAFSLRVVGMTQAALAPAMDGRVASLAKLKECRVFAPDNEITRPFIRVLRNGGNFIKVGSFWEALSLARSGAGLGIVPGVLKTLDTYQWLGQIAHAPLDGVSRIHAAVVRREKTLTKKHGLEPAAELIRAIKTAVATQPASEEKSTIVKRAMPVDPEAYTGHRFYSCFVEPNFRTPRWVRETITFVAERPEQREDGTVPKGGQTLVLTGEIKNQGLKLHVSGGVIGDTELFFVANEVERGTPCDSPKVTFTAFFPHYREIDRSGQVIRVWQGVWMGTTDVQRVPVVNAMVFSTHPLSFDELSELSRDMTIQPMLHAAPPLDASDSQVGAG